MKQLQQERRWCLWRREADPAGRPTKIPYSATGRRAKSDDPRTWDDFATVTRANAGGSYSGRGLFFSGRLCGVDVDGDHDGGTNTNPLTDEVLTLFSGTYAETSPSGTGVHILFYVDPEAIPHTEDRKLDPAYYLKNPHNGLEFYAGGLTNRYFTFTGNCISAGEAVTDQTAQLLTFLDKYMKRPDKGNKAQQPTPGGPGGPVQPAQPIDIRIPARLAQARAAANGEAFRALYDLGDLAAYNSDHSAADIALCGKLAFWLDADPVLIDEAFRASALMRPKWDERRGAETYGEMTIRKAIENTTEVYQAPQRPTAAQDFAAPRVLQYRPGGRDLTDAGNAELFARLNRDRLRWCDALGWLTWDGKYWDNDNHAAQRLALDFSKAMLKEAAENFAESTGNGDDVNPAAKAYLNHAMKLRGANAQRNMLDLAKARLAIRARELDADPEILNTVAGIVDLRSGQLAPHDPTRYCTKLAPVAPSRRGAETWEAFLDLVTCGDGDLKAYLRRVAGMAIVGKVYEEGIQITVGGGRNGKSTFYSALSKVLGDYAGTIDPDVLITKRNESWFELAPLRGKRLAVCSELETGQRLSTKALKRISSRDEINVERKFRDQETVKPTHHIILHTNVLPIVGDARDGGTWRRLTVIPFNAVMPTGSGDIKAYDDVLVKEAGGAILQWMIDGAVEYLAAGGSLGELPEAVLKATNQYREGEDWLQPFLDECCIFDAGGTAQAVELFSAYQAHAARRGDRYIRKGREFYDALAEAFTARGLKFKKPGNKVTWYGVRVMPGIAYQEPGAAADFDDVDPLS